MIDSDSRPGHGISTTEQSAAQIFDSTVHWDTLHHVMKVPSSSPALGKSLLSQLADVFGGWMTLADLLSKQEGCFHEVRVGIWREISLGKKIAYIVRPS